jgi:mRNA-degrading endonuclease RelE of RelBE toxin-antitoxin system
MRMTRHAKNRARFVGATLSEVEQVIDDPLYVERDKDGKPHYIGDLRGIRVRIVVALDEPELIVTIHETRQ